jgi:hypothetical protein
MTELPTTVRITQAFASRIPTQRVIDAVRHAEGGVPFDELMTAQPFRVAAFRALLRDFPGYDMTALWLHAYDVEVAIDEVDPTNGASPTPAPPSATTGTLTPTP